MTDLCNQPFLLSLHQGITPTDNPEARKTILRGQHRAFKNYVEERCSSEVSAPKRFQFLKRVDYELCSIRLQYADAVRSGDVGFYHFWSMLIVDMRRFLRIGVDTLYFQRDCPPHLLSAPTPIFPAYKWMGTRNDLTEGLAAIFQTDVIRLKDGSRISFAVFAKFIGSFFGIAYSNPHGEMQRILNRKKNRTPFLNRMIDCLNQRGEKMDE